MEIRFNVSEILPVLSQCATVVPRKTAIPILKSFQVAVRYCGDSGVKAFVTASDGEVWLTRRAVLTGGSDDWFDFCIDAFRLTKALSTLKEGEVRMVLDSRTMSATCEYDRGSFSMPYETSEEYPRPKDEETEQNSQIVSGQSVLRSIKRVEYAALHEDTIMPVLKGVYFDMNGDRMAVVATDTQMLAMARDPTTRSDGGSYGFILPNKAASVLKNVLPSVGRDVKVSHTGKSVKFSNADFLLVARTIDGKYPNYERIIPKECGIVSCVNGSDFRNALKRVLPMTDETYGYVTLDFVPESGSVVLRGENVMFGKSASETVGCTYVKAGTPTSIAFTGKNLLSSVSHLERNDEIFFEINGEASPAVIYSTDKDAELSLLIPKRIVR